MSDSEGSSFDADEGWLNELDSEEEAPYELAPRKRKREEDGKGGKGAKRLPVRLSDGRVVMQEVDSDGDVDGKPAGSKAVYAPRDSEAEDTDDSDLEREADAERRLAAAEAEASARSLDVATGARFGRRAVGDVLVTKNRKARVMEAREQIASLSQEVTGDPENGIGLLRRLGSFAARYAPPPSTASTKGEEGREGGVGRSKTPTDPLIRQLALLSLLAIYVDIVPGYRIRALTDHEKAEKVSQEVARRRDFEQGLVANYQAYLKVLEGELKGTSELKGVALKCMCTLLVRIPHFNFRVNLLQAVVARLSRKSWSEDSEMCFASLCTLLDHDLTGEASLETVRLLNRMIKERHFRVHPRVLDILLHLRLRAELSVRASETRAEGKRPSGGEVLKGKGKGKKEQKPVLSKKAKKALKEKKEIEKEMKEAEAEVDQNERAGKQTETLKLLFVLYFSILKQETSSPLLPSALEGISRFAHLVSVDFFRDLLSVLRQILSANAKGGWNAEELAMKKGEEGDEAEAAILEDTERRRNGVRESLLCIATAFDLLSGQGEALNIDLTDFITHLYGLLVPLSLSPTIDERPDVPGSSSGIEDFTATANGRHQSSPRDRGKKKSSSHLVSEADLLFRCLDQALIRPRSVPSERTASFAKRLLTASLHWPPQTALRALDAVSRMLVKESRLEGMLSTEDRAADGVYRPDVDDPHVAKPFATCFWELATLESSHWDARLREKAGQLARWAR